MSKAVMSGTVMSRTVMSGAARPKAAVVSLATRCPECVVAEGCPGRGMGVFGRSLPRIRTFLQHFFQHRHHQAPCCKTLRLVSRTARLAERTKRFSKAPRRCSSTSPERRWEAPTSQVSTSTRS